MDIRELRLHWKSLVFKLAVSVGVDEYRVSLLRHISGIFYLLLFSKGQGDLQRKEYMKRHGGGMEGPWCHMCRSCAVIGFFAPSPYLHLWSLQDTLWKT